MFLEVGATNLILGPILAQLMMEGRKVEMAAAHPVDDVHNSRESVLIVGKSVPISLLHIPC